jgi:hypothetical protein
MSDSVLRFALLVIGAITVVTGAGQILLGERMLAWMASGATPISVHLFGTVGMFMVVTGAMMVQCLLIRSGEDVVTLWIAVQKFAAAVLVLIAWTKGLFLGLTLGVAAFDCVSGILALLYWLRVRS